MNPKEKAEIKVAALCAAVLIVIIVSLALCQPAKGQSCVVKNHFAEFADTGSGTLIYRDDGIGYVATCSHIFDTGTGKPAVEFPGGTKHWASLVYQDKEADLALLRISSPPDCAAPVRLIELPRGKKLTACGSGPSRLRCMTGAVASYASDQTGHAKYVKVSGMVAVGGDSGGGVYDEEGHFVGVLWGTDFVNTVTMSSGDPLLDMLEYVFEVQYCPDGQCELRPRQRSPGRYVVQQPRPRQQNIVEQPIVRKPPPTPKIDIAATLQEMTDNRVKIDALIADIQALQDRPKPGKACNCEGLQVAHDDWQISVQADIDARLTAMQAEFDTRLEALSRLPGPAGPPGESLDIKEIAAAVAEQIKPFTFNLRVHPDASYQSVNSGDYVTLPIGKLPLQQE